MIRTTLFGGSFNPVHVGHLALARQVLRENLSDEVWLMVSPQNPLKEQAELAPEALRLQMARLATASIEGVEASDFEFHLPRPSYTWRTLEALEATYPERIFSLLIGGDNWALFDRWARHDAIRATHDIIVYPREGYPVRPAALPPRVHLLHAPLYPFSSTDVRRAVKAGGNIEAYVPECIAHEVKAVYG